MVSDWLRVLGVRVSPSYSGRNLSSSISAGRLCSTRAAGALLLCIEPHQPYVCKVAALPRQEHSGACRAGNHLLVRVRREDSRS
jgi:hypothetical protein